MSFVVRPAKLDDLDRIYEISRQFTLLNLPSNKDVILKKIEKSKESFSGKLSVEKTNYFLVCEDLEEKKVIGCCQIIGQKGSVENPSYSFKISKKEMFSPEL
ncbi:arginine N-succinyltransferase, partial [bacterium]|nr:arginine N-succinyltransferase [bacterium]